jgi:hypothetical protein
MNRWSAWLRPKLTPTRVALAFGVALAADAVQLLLGPFGWFWPDEVIDVMAMVATTLLIGVHPLLLPTFVIEFLPIADMFPTWTACVASVVALRRNELRSRPTNLPDIDVRPTSTSSR